jgi:hypothetical protein
MGQKALNLLSGQAVFLRENAVKPIGPKAQSSYADKLTSARDSPTTFTTQD